jgi:hypothetical protein
MFALTLIIPFPVAARTADASVADSSGHTVISYPASFFASMGVDTAYNMVLRVPGFVFDDGSNLRGFASSAGNVLIDGQRPASKTDDLAGILTRLPASKIERIDLIRGGAPGIDMQGKTIIANITRKKERGFHGVVTAGTYKPVGIPFDPQLRLEGTWDWSDHHLEASLFGARYHDGTQSDGPHQIFGPAGQLLDFSDMQNQLVSFQYLGTAAYETSLLGGKMRLNLTLEDQPYNKFNIDNFLVAGHQVERDRQHQADAELGQHYDRDLSDGWSVELLGLQHFNTTDTDSIFDTAADQQTFAQRNRGGEMIGRGIMHWKSAGGPTLDTGVEFAYNWLDTHTVFRDNGTQIEVPAGDVFVSERRGEAFATALVHPLASLSIETGIRVEESTIASSVDVIQSKTLLFPKPRLVATWTPDTLDQLRVRVEREVGQLDFSNFAANAALNSTGVAAGNPDLLPQRDWAFEISYDRHFWTDAVVSLTLRHLLLQDVVDRVPVFAPSGVFDEPGNIGGGNENDIVASFSLPLDRLGLAHATIHGVGTWRLSQVRDPTTGQARAISVQHPFDAEIHFNQDLPTWNLSCGLDSYPANRTTSFRFDEIDSTLNGIENTIYLEYRPQPDITLRLQTDLEQIATETTRQVFSGPRNIDPLRLVDAQRRHFGPIMFFRVRKTLD